MQHPTLDPHTELPGYPVGLFDLEGITTRRVNQKDGLSDLAAFILQTSRDLMRDEPDLGLLV